MDEDLDRGLKMDIPMTLKFAVLLSQGIRFVLYEPKTGTGRNIWVIGIDDKIGRVKSIRSKCIVYKKLFGRLSGKKRFFEFSLYLKTDADYHLEEINSCLIRKNANN